MIFKGYAHDARHHGMTMNKSYDFIGNSIYDDNGDIRYTGWFEWGPEQPSHLYVEDDSPEAVYKAINEGRAARFNTGKPQLSYILDAPNAIVGLASVFEFGAEKYSRDNWKKGLERNEVIDSLLRHLTKSQAGEVLDDETGKDHLYHVLWNALVLAEQYGETGNEVR